MTDLNPQKIYERLVTLGDDWAEKRAAADLLEETKKTILALYKNDSPEKSEAAKERHALADPDYERHLEEMVKARGEANKAKVRYDSAQTYVELLRTDSVNQREVNKFST